MVELAHGVAHDLDDLGVAVADDGAHLAGAEVEDAAAVGVPHEAALRALGDDRREVAAVADEVRARLCPEHGIGVARTHLGHVVHVAAPQLAQAACMSYRGSSPVSSHRRACGACGTMGPGCSSADRCPIGGQDAAAMHLLSGAVV